MVSAREKRLAAKRKKHGITPPSAGEQREARKTAVRHKGNVVDITERRKVTAPTPTEKPKKTIKEKRADLPFPLRILTSPKTTAVLGGTLAALTGGAAIAARIAAGKLLTKAPAVITRFASRHQLDTLTGKLVARGTQQTQRAFVGRPPASGIDKIFSVVRPIAKRFATNTKSTSFQFNI